VLFVVPAGAAWPHPVMLVDRAGAAPAGADTAGDALIVSAKRPVAMPHRVWEARQRISARKTIR